MEVLDALKTRRSVRNFKKKPVEEKKIEEIVDAARLAPSGNNLQPVEYIVVTDRNRREEIADIATYGNFIADAPVCIAVCSKDVGHDIEDGSAATENILLAAHGLGLASCWVAGYQKDYCTQIEELLNIPEKYRLISLLPIGYSDKETTPPKKRTLKDVLHQEEFKS
jgi:nitroreductase